MLKTRLTAIKDRYQAQNEVIELKQGTIDLQKHVIGLQMRIAYLETEMLEVRLKEVIPVAEPEEKEVEMKE